MAISRADFWSFITELVTRNPNLGIPALEDGLFANLLIFDYLYYTRWHDDLQHFMQAHQLDAQNHWLEFAKDTTTWLELEDKYVEWSHRNNTRPKSERSENLPQ